MDTKEREGVQAKGICNIFNKTVTEKFPNLEKVLPIQVQETSKQKKRLGQNRTSPWHCIIKEQAQRTEKEY
jgi:hypothetical protein